MDLTLYHAEISQVLQIIHHLFNIEGAVFDDSAVLVTGSKGYLERKGTAVHKPSIMEVIENDEVIVLRPGEMRSCIGCRFSGNCPATLELLKRIVIDGTPVGVLSFSAFSESAHDRIAEQMDYFERIMVDFSDLLATLIKNAHEGDTSVFEKQFTALTSLVSEGLLVTNARGEITASNGPALAMLSGSCLTSIHDFLPPELSAEVLSPQPVQNRSVSLRPDCELTITSVPILGADGSSEGAALRLSAKSDPILPPTRHVDASRMRGSGTQMASVRRRMNKILSSPSSVYISGETGTGKGLLARAIHYESNRRDKPFVIISCANIPETLFESELFGYEGGAFTGALKSGKQGKMELIVQKAVELGAYGIVPVFMDRTVVTDKGNFGKKIQRWQKVSNEAVKQCKRGIIPQIEDAIKMPEVIQRFAGFDLVLFPYENEDGTTIKEVLRPLAGGSYAEASTADGNAGKSARPENIAIIIGPEGGFSEKEAQQIVEAGGKSVSLGKTTLRTETAGLAAIAMTLYELEL